MARLRLAAWLFALFLGLYWLTMGGHLYTGDAATSVATARSLLEGRGFAIPFDPQLGGSRGPGGEFYGQYGLGTVLTSLPAVWLGDRMAAAAPETATPATRRLVAGLPLSCVNALFSAGTVALLFLCASGLGYSTATALRLSAATGLGTMLWPYAGFDFSEPQAAFLFLLAFHELLALRRGASSRRALVAGAAVGYALLTKVYVAVVAPLFLWLAWESGGRRAAPAALFSAPLAAAALAIAWYNHARFGSPFTTGYAMDVQGTHVPLLHGLWGLLLSPGKSALLFNPPLLTALAGAATFHRAHPLHSRFVWLFAAAHLLFFGIQQNWDGDWSWGPRYLLPAVPFVMLAGAPVFEPVSSPASRRPGRRLLVLAVVAVGMLVQSLAVAVSPNDGVRYLTSQKALLGDYLPDHPDKLYVPYHQHHWNPDLSPVRVHGFLLGAALGLQPADATLRLHSTAEEWTDERSHRLLPFVELAPAGEHAGSLDLWFMTLPLLLAGTPAVPLLGALGLATFLLIGLGLPRVARAYRRARREEADQRGDEVPGP